LRLERKTRMVEHRDDAVIVSRAEHAQLREFFREAEGDYPPEPMHLMISGCSVGTVKVGAEFGGCPWCGGVLEPQEYQGYSDEKTVEARCARCGVFWIPFEASGMAAEKPPQEEA